MLAKLIFTLETGMHRAMVFVLSNLTKDNPLITLRQVAISDLILILAFPYIEKNYFRI